MSEELVSKELTKEIFEILGDKLRLDYDLFQDEPLGHYDDHMDRMFLITLNGHIVGTVMHGDYFDHEPEHWDYEEFDDDQLYALCRSCVDFTTNPSALHAVKECMKDMGYDIRYSEVVKPERKCACVVCLTTDPEQAAEYVGFGNASTELLAITKAIHEALNLKGIPNGE